MEIIFAIVTILVLTFLAWLANKTLPFKVCPICVGVSGTWVLVGAVVLAGWLPKEQFIPVLTLLMGGTVVGIAYQGEKVFTWAAKNIFMFRVPLIIVGFLIAYFSIENLSWAVLLFDAAILGLVFYFYFIRQLLVKNHVLRGGGSQRVKELEKKMEECC